MIPTMPLKKGSSDDCVDYQRPDLKRPVFLKAKDWMNISEVFSERILKPQNSNLELK
jgi:hypothetical protein